VLVPTRLERTLLQRLGGLAGAPAELCGFGPVAAAARTAGLLALRKPRRVLLLGIGGTLRPEELPVGAAASFASVRLEGLGARRGTRWLAPSELGFAQWDDGRTRIEERLALQPARRGVRGELLTVCTAAGSRAEARARARRHAAASVEDMEGFGVALACALARVPLTVVRGVSNVAGERDRRRWDVRAALDAARTLAGTWLAREGRP